MDYCDFTLPSKEDFEAMAKAYKENKFKHCFKVVRADNEKENEAMRETIACYATVSTLLFRLGGFFNTKNLYSLTERQFRKLSQLYNYNEKQKMPPFLGDKFSTFIQYLSVEFSLISSLVTLLEESEKESEIKLMLFSRLTLLSQIFKIN